MKTVVLVSKTAAKTLLKCPPQVQQKFAFWQIQLETQGIRTVRKIPGFHDEPLHGQRKGERSVRLNRFWRLIYVERSDGKLEIVEVTEVIAHAY